METGCFLGAIRRKARPISSRHQSHVKMCNLFLKNDALIDNRTEYSYRNTWSDILFSKMDLSVLKFKHIYSQYQFNFDNYKIDFKDMNEIHLSTWAAPFIVYKGSK